MRDILFGVPPEELDKHPLYFTTYKSSKKGKVSFLLTKALLDSLWLTGKKLKKHPQLIIHIGEYTFSGILTKNKESK